LFAGGKDLGRGNLPTLIDTAVKGVKKGGGVLKNRETVEEGHSSPAEIGRKKAWLMLTAERGAITGRKKASVGRMGVEAGETKTDGVRLVN